MRCRHCGEPVSKSFVDLGASPPSNAYLSAGQLDVPERSYPLRVLVCGECRLVQTEDFAEVEELFSADYAYYSGFSTSWVEHCARFTEEMVRRFELGAASMVVEVASNDGTLLNRFHQRGIQSVGIEPTAGTARAARLLGLDIRQEFLTMASAERLRSEGVNADLLAANNVVAHVPDINDFVGACCRLLAPGGVATFEFPHLMRLVEGKQFDTIYHEHFSYLSLTVMERVAAKCGLSIFDVEEIPTHGGSLRVFMGRSDGVRREVSDSVERLLESESLVGVDTDDFYQGFQGQAEQIAEAVLDFLVRAHRSGRRVAGYGAAAKGNTLLNFAGIDGDLLPYVVDQNPAKQGLYLPGSRIPIVSEDRIHLEQPDHVLLLPWNLRTELVERLNYVRKWGATFVTAIPEVEIW